MLRCVQYRKIRRVIKAGERIYICFNLRSLISWLNIMEQELGLERRKDSTRDELNQWYLSYVTEHFLPPESHRALAQAPPGGWLDERARYEAMYAGSNGKNHALEEGHTILMELMDLMQMDPVQAIHKTRSMLSLMCSQMRSYLDFTVRGGLKADMELLSLTVSLLWYYGLLKEVA